MLQIVGMPTYSVVINVYTFKRVAVSLHVTVIIIIHLGVKYCFNNALQSLKQGSSCLAIGNMI